jgi:hypothetical protein
MTFEAEVTHFLEQHWSAIKPLAESRGDWSECMIVIVDDSFRGVAGGRNGKPRIRIEAREGIEDLLGVSCPGLRDVLAALPAGTVPVFFVADQRCQLTELCRLDN